MLLRRVNSTIAIYATAVAIGVVAAFPAAISAQDASGNGRINARSAPASGGVVGTVDCLSISSLVVSISAGQKVTIEEKPSTEYRKGTDSIPASAITKGDSVFVLGIVSGSTIAATR